MATSQPTCRVLTTPPVQSKNSIMYKCGPLPQPTKVHVDRNVPQICASIVCTSTLVIQFNAHYKVMLSAHADAPTPLK